MLKMKNNSLLVFLGIVFLSFTFDKTSNIKLRLQAPAGMVLVEGGTFKMGNPAGDDDEKPVHEVTLDGFYLDKYEVTNQQFCDFINVKGNQNEGGVTWLEIKDEDCNIEFVGGKFQPKKGFANKPVIEVNWFGANAYAKHVGKRLPSEAEWEFAARGGKLSKGYSFSGGNNAGEIAWYDANADQQTQNVGTKKPNELGIYDMSGNVWEWTNDWYDDKYYRTSPSSNPKGPAGPHPIKKGKVLRGGGWVSIDKELTVFKRDFNAPTNCFYLNGFRCAKDL